MRPAEFTKNGRKATISGVELISHLAAVLSALLIKRGFDAKNSEEITLHVMDEVRHQYGGQNVYFPRDLRLKVSQRDMEIYERYTRNELSMAEIVQEYGISLQWAYAIVRTVRDKLKEMREAEREAKKTKECERWKREN